MTINPKLESLKSGIRQLDEKLEAMSESAKQKFSVTRAALETQINDAERKLNQAEDSGQENLEKAKSEAQNTLNRLENAYIAAKAEIQKNPVDS